MHNAYKVHQINGEHSQNTSNQHIRTDGHNKVGVAKLVTSWGTNKKKAVRRRWWRKYARWRRNVRIGEGMLRKYARWRRNVCIGEGMLRKYAR